MALPPVPSDAGFATPSVSSKALPISIGSMAAVPGFQHGLRHPALVVNFLLAPPHSRASLAEVQSELVEALSRQGHAASPKAWAERTADSVNWVATTIYWMHELQRAARLPVFERGRIVLIGIGAEHIRAALTCFDKALDVTATALAWLVRLLNAQASCEGPAQVLGSLPEIVCSLAAFSPPTPTYLFLEAAHSADLPSLRVVEDLLQFGHGAKGRRIYGTCTDETSVIATRFGRLKQLASQILRQSGVPTPAQALVSTGAEAVEAAEKIGYPVVVKPANLDCGLGVATGLRTADEVQAAFVNARSHSAHTLVEKHIEGNDYRLLIFRGELLAAARRVPGGVIGDGASSVRILLERLNAERGGADRHSPMRPIVLDEEALMLLERCERDPEHVPASGEFVQLRYAANTARGGTLLDVLATVHPDNHRLAARAAAALQADLCGVDMIIPDIARSWRETGAAICEVNPGPDFGQITSRNAFPRILQKLVPATGRIPIAVVFGSNPDSMLVANLARRLAEVGLIVGWTDRTGVWVDDDPLSAGPVTAYAGGRMLLLHKDVDVALLSADAMGVLRTGLPADRFDVLVLAGSHVGAPDPRDPQARSRVLEAAVHAVLPACKGRVLRAAGAPSLPYRRAVGEPDPVLGDHAVVEQAAQLLEAACRRLPEHDAPGRRSRG